LACAAGEEKEYYEKVFSAYEAVCLSGTQLVLSASFKNASSLKGSIVDAYYEYYGDNNSDRLNRIESLCDLYPNDLYIVTSLALINKIIFIKANRTLAILIKQQMDKAEANYNKDYNEIRERYIANYVNVRSRNFYERFEIEPRRSEITSYTDRAAKIFDTADPGEIGFELRDYLDQLKETKKQAIDKAKANSNGVQIGTIEETIKDIESKHSTKVKRAESDADDEFIDNIKSVCVKINSESMGSDKNDRIPVSHIDYLYSEKRIAENEAKKKEKEERELQQKLKAQEEEQRRRDTPATVSNHHSDQSMKNWKMPPPDDAPQHEEKDNSGKSKHTGLMVFFILLIVAIGIFVLAQILGK